MLSLQVGCLALGFDRDLPEEEGFQPSTLSLAVGATVAVTLEEGGSCRNAIDEGCLSERPDTILSVTSTRVSVADLGPVEFDRREITFELQAFARGATELRVEYEDFRGQVVVDTVEVRVAEIDHVDTQIHCSTSGHTGEVYPVTSGSGFTFRQQAFDDAGNQLAVGTMELIEDFAGFSVSGPPRRDGDIRSLTAPSSTGARRLQAVGLRTEPLEFVVFESGAFDVALSEANQALDPAVRLERLVAGAPVCVHEGPALAVLQVESGSCRPMIAGTEIAGRMPIDLGEDAFVVSLAGSGTCTVSASRTGGGDTSLSLEIDNPPPAPEPGRGTPLAATPVEYRPAPPERQTCLTTRNLTNGKCEIVNAAGYILPGADCLFDVRWLRSHHDGTPEDRDITGQAVGVGLTTQVRAKIEYEAIGLVPLGAFAPNNLTLAIEPAGLAFELDGCTDGGARVVNVVAGTADRYNVVMTADNAFDATDLSVVARDVDRFSVSFEPVGDSSPWYFVGNDATFVPAYADAGGGNLNGVGTILVSSDEPGAQASIGETYRIETGTMPGIITVASQVAADEYRLTVVDGEGIAAVSGLGSGPIPLDTEHCVRPNPSGPTGAAIHGQAPVRPVLELTGDETLVFQSAPFPFSEEEVCLRAVAPGTTEAVLRWGSASDSQTWVVP